MTSVLIIAIVVINLIAPITVSEPIGEIPDGFNDCPENMNCAIEEEEPICEIPKDFKLWHVDGEFPIEIGKVTKESGQYSYDSFMSAIELCENKKADAVVTMPIHKEAWMMADLEYKGHTDLLRHHFKTDAIMMLGCEKMFVALFTEHVPLKAVPSFVTQDRLTTFLTNLHRSIGDKKVAVLGLNPHAGDNGVFGDEEREIEKAIKVVAFCITYRYSI